MTCIVFLGPTLPLAEARAILPAGEFWPPASQGSVLRAITCSPKAIAIIDGVFESEPAVWHKEILFALSSGIRVFGSSSMGALRAAETFRFGTEGIGRIFEMYSSGELEDDDNVAVSHQPASGGFKAVSIAQVNIWWGLTLAAEEGLIQAATARTLIERSRVRHYRDRSWQAVLGDARDIGIAPTAVQALQDLIDSGRTDLKADDARELLRFVSSELARGWTPRKREFDFEPTHVWHMLVDNETPILSGEHGRTEHITARDLHEHVIVAMPNRDQVRRAVMNLITRAGEVDRLGLSAPAYPEDELEDLIEARQEGRGRRHYVQALAAMGLLDEVRTALCAKAELRARGALEHPSGSTGPSNAELCRWYEARFGAIGPDLDRHALRLGLRSGEELLRAMREQYLFEAAARAGVVPRPRTKSSVDFECEDLAARHAALDD